MSVLQPLRSLVSSAPAIRLALMGVLAACLLSACGVMPDKEDETLGWSANKLYAEAQDYLKEGDFAKAAKYFEILEGRYPFGRYAQQAQLNTAYAYYRDGDMSAAQAAADRFIQLHPNHAVVDYAYYLKGLINFQDNLGWLGRFSGQDLSERDPKAARAAFDSFKVLVTRFPSSKYTPDAIARMRYIVNALAKHEVQAAKYYYRRRAYIAAINRAQTAIKEYDQAPALEEAVYVMVRSYDALGMNDLRDDAKRVLAKNWPESKFLR